MSAARSTSDLDRYLIVDDSCDDVTEILAVVCERSRFTLPDWAIELDGGRS